jgi:AmmeMemoRadiSam system protein A
MLSDEERAVLLALARRSVETALEGRPTPEPEKVTPAIATPAAAFVTIHKGTRLRGCIGTFDRSKRLWEVVVAFARQAAFHDSRFPPVRREELPHLQFEISVLSPLRKLDDPLDLRLGIDGVWIIGARGERGTYLPQVATETGWSKEEFLSNCARSKAGMAPDAWRDPKRATVHAYTAEVFSEGGH